MAFAWLAETWQLLVEAVARCESGSRSSGCRKGMRGQHDIPFGYPERVGANAEGHGASRGGLLANAFGPKRVLCDAVVVITW
jgi:hypothetical protein